MDGHHGWSQGGGGGAGASSRIAPLSHPHRRRTSFARCSTAQYPRWSALRSRHCQAGRHHFHITSRLLGTAPGLLILLEVVVFARRILRLVSAEDAGGCSTLGSATRDVVECGRKRGKWTGWRGRAFGRGGGWKRPLAGGLCRRSKQQTAVHFIIPLVVIYRRIAH